MSEHLPVDVQQYKPRVHENYELKKTRDGKTRNQLLTSVIQNQTCQTTAKQTPSSHETKSQSKSGAGDEVETHLDPAITTKVTRQASVDDGNGFDFASMAFVPFTPLLQMPDKEKANEAVPATGASSNVKQTRSLDEQPRSAYGYVVKSRRQFSRNQNMPSTMPTTKTKLSVISDGSKSADSTRRSASDSPARILKPSSSMTRPAASLETLRANLLKATPMTAHVIDRHPLIQDKTFTNVCRKDAEDIYEPTGPSTYDSNPQKMMRPPVFIGHRLPQLVSQPTSGNQIAEPAQHIQRQTVSRAPMTVSRPDAHGAIYSVTRYSNSCAARSSAGSTANERLQNVMPSTVPCYYSQQFFPPRYVGNSSNPCYVNTKTSPVARRDQPPKTYPYLQVQNQMYTPVHRNNQYRNDRTVPISTPPTVQYRIPTTTQYVPLQDVSSRNDGQQLFSNLQIPNRRRNTTTANPQLKVPPPRLVPLQRPTTTVENVTRSSSFGFERRHPFQPNYAAVHMAPKPTTDVTPAPVHRYNQLMSHRRVTTQKCSQSRDPRWIRSEAALRPQLNFNNDNRFRDNVTERHNPGKQDFGNRRNIPKPESFNARSNATVPTLPRILPKPSQNDSNGFPRQLLSPAVSAAHWTDVSSGSKPTQITQWRTDHTDNTRNRLKRDSLEVWSNTTVPGLPRLVPKPSQRESSASSSLSPSQLSSVKDTSQWDGVSTGRKQTPISQWRTDDQYMSPDPCSFSGSQPYPAEICKHIREPSKSRTSFRTNSRPSSDATQPSAVINGEITTVNINTSHSVSTRVDKDDGDITACVVTKNDVRTEASVNHHSKADGMNKSGICASIAREPNPVTIGVSNKTNKDSNKHDKATVNMVNTKHCSGSRDTESAEAARKLDSNEGTSKVRVAQQVAPLFKKALKMLQTQKRILSKPGDVVPGPVPPEDLPRKLPPKPTKHTEKLSSLKVLSTSSSIDNQKDRQREKRPKFRIKRRKKRGKEQKGSASGLKTLKDIDTNDNTKNDSHKCEKQGSAEREKEHLLKDDDNWLVEDDDEVKGDTTVHYYIRKDADNWNNNRITRAKSNSESGILLGGHIGDKEPKKPAAANLSLAASTSRTGKKGKKAVASKRRKLIRQKSKYDKEGLVGRRQEENSTGDLQLKKNNGPTSGRRMTSASLSAMAWEECREVAVEQWRQRAVQEGLPRKQIKEVTENTVVSVEKRRGPHDFQELLVKTWQNLIGKSAQKIEDVESGSDVKVCTVTRGSQKACDVMPAKSVTSGADGGYSSAMDLTAKSRFDIFVKSIIDNAKRECDLKTPCDNDDDKDSEKSSQQECPDLPTWEKEVVVDTQNMSNGNNDDRASDTGFVAAQNVLSDKINGEDIWLYANDTAVADEEVAKITSAMHSKAENHNELVANIERRSLADDHNQIEIMPLMTSSPLANVGTNNQYVAGEQSAGYRVQWHIDADAGMAYLIPPCNEEVVYTDEQVWIGEIQTETVEPESENCAYEEASEQKDYAGKHQRSELKPGHCADGRVDAEADHEEHSGSDDVDRAKPGQLPVGGEVMQQSNREDTRQQSDGGNSRLLFGTVRKLD